MTETGVVLTGGGARAAYQVGVLRAISDMYPDWEHPFRVIIGTSAGAINAVALAGGGGIFRHNVSRLERIWAELQVDQIYRSQTLDILRNMSSVARRLLAGSAQGLPMALLNNSPLRHLLATEVDFAAVSQAIREDRLSAVGVNACGYSTGQNVCFFDAREGLASWTQGQRAGCRTTLELPHVMASSAIPTVFPPVLINREYFGDGVTRQMAHVSPALRLGAERVLVIGVSANHHHGPERPNKPGMPGFGQIFAQVFNGMFLDTLDYDLERLRLVNQMVDLIPPQRLKAANLELRPIRLLEISPSEPFDALASQYLDGMPAVLRKLTGAQAGQATPGASLASYLLFDHRFCQALIKLGYQDAQRQSRQIEDFFSEPSERKQPAALD